MRAARAGPVLRGQCFANEQILRGPALAALSGPVKGQYRLVCRVEWFSSSVLERALIAL